MIVRKRMLVSLATGLVAVGLLATAAMAAPQPPGSVITTHSFSVASSDGVDSGPGLSFRIETADGDHERHLAEALGVPEDALQAARIKAHDAQIQAAVKAGKITARQGEALAHGLGGPFVDPAIFGDSEKQLAEALEITTEKLQAAEEAATKADLAQAVKEGRMTQEQADQMTGQQALARYIAEKDVYANTIKAALKDGALTQAQADALLKQPAPMLLGGPAGAVTVGAVGDGGPGIDVRSFPAVPALPQPVP